MEATASPGCAFRCFGAPQCSVGWPDGSCGAKPKGEQRPPKLPLWEKMVKAAGPVELIFDESFNVVGSKVYVKQFEDMREVVARHSLALLEDNSGPNDQIEEVPEQLEGFDCRAGFSPTRS